MILISDFCYQHGACREGREWAIDNCSDMAEVWQQIKPEWLIWVATRLGVLTDRELRLFIVFCARQVEHLLTDQRSRDAIDTAEKFAKGEATCEELAAAWGAAWAAAWGADVAEASDAARAAARTATAAAARTADAARAAAMAAAADAAAARTADAAATRAAQAEWLRANTEPNFNREVTQ